MRALSFVDAPTAPKCSNIYNALSLIDVEDESKVPNPHPEGSLPTPHLLNVEVPERRRVILQNHDGLDDPPSYVNAQSI